MGTSGFLFCMETLQDSSLSDDGHPGRSETISPEPFIYGRHQASFSCNGELATAIDFAQCAPQLTPYGCERAQDCQEFPDRFQPKILEYLYGREEVQQAKETGQDGMAQDEGPSTSSGLGGSSTQDGVDAGTGQHAARGNTPVAGSSRDAFTEDDNRRVWEFHRVLPETTGRLIHHFRHFPTIEAATSMVSQFAAKTRGATFDRRGLFITLHATRRPHIHIVHYCETKQGFCRCYADRRWLADFRSAKLGEFGICRNVCVNIKHFFGNLGQYLVQGPSRTVIYSKPINSPEEILLGDIHERCRVQQDEVCSQDVSGPERVAGNPGSANSQDQPDFQARRKNTTWSDVEELVAATIRVHWVNSYVKFQRFLEKSAMDTESSLLMEFKLDPAVPDRYKHIDTLQDHFNYIRFLSRRKTSKQLEEIYERQLDHFGKVVLHEWTFRDYSDHLTILRPFGLSHYRMSIEESSLFFGAMLYHQFHSNDAVEVFMIKTIGWYDKMNGKQCAILLEGLPNSGKTLFADSLASICLHVGRVSKLNKNSGFPFDDVIGKRMFYGDELRWDYQDWNDFMKKLTAGSEVHAAKKFKSNQLIEPLPCLFCNNSNPFYRDADAFKSRLQHYYWRPLPEGLQEMTARLGYPHPIGLLHFETTMQSNKSYPEECYKQLLY